MRGENKKDTIFISSSERMTQGCPLAMIGYGILLLSLMRKLKKEFEKNSTLLGTQIMVRLQVLWNHFFIFSETL